MNEAARKFLILGCQRSGTTVLGMALQAHPDIALVEENNRNFHRPGGLTLRLDLGAVNEWPTPAVSRIGFKVPRETHRVDQMIATAGRLELIWVTRRVYSVVASMMALQNSAGQSWALNFAAKEIEKFLQAEGVDSRFADEFRRSSSLVSARERAVALATLCWLVKLDSERRAVKNHPNKVYRISYEQLVSDPRNVLSGVLRFLELDWDDGVLRHPERLSGNRPGGASTQRPIDSKSLYHWRARLSGSDQELIDRIVDRHSVACSS